MSSRWSPIGIVEAQCGCLSAMATTKMEHGVGGSGGGGGSSMAERRLQQLERLLLTNSSDDGVSISIETLLDVLLVLYDECCSSALRREKTVSDFIELSKFSAFFPVVVAVVLFLKIVKIK